MRFAILRWTSAFIVSVAHLAAGQSALAQKQIADDVACPACRISWVPAISIKGVLGVGEIYYRPLSVTLDGQGRFWVIYSDGDLPAVYSASGQFVADVGRMGAGPGEFRSPGVVLPVPGDSTVVFDSQLQRATVFDPDLRPARTINLGPVSFRYAVVDTWPMIVASGVVRSAASYGHSFHRIDLGSSAGRVIQSFGGDSESAVPSREHLMARPFEAVRGGYWAVSRTEYRITSYDRAFRVQAELFSRPEWFPESVEERSMGFREPPSPGLDVLFFDSRGYLWVFGRAAREDYAEAWPPMEPGIRSIASRDVDFSKLWDTVVEVIDPNSGKLIARRRLDFLVLSVLRDGRVVVYKETPQGIPYLEVLREDHDISTVQLSPARRDP
jgi:hypothetical protein